MFVVLVPSVSKTGSIADDNGMNQAGFVCLVVLQCVADLMLLLALDHEQRFRSSGTHTLECARNTKFVCFINLSFFCSLVGSPPLCAHRSTFNICARGESLGMRLLLIMYTSDSGQPAGLFRL